MFLTKKLAIICIGLRKRSTSRIICPAVTCSAASLRIHSQWRRRRAEKFLHEFNTLALPPASLAKSALLTVILKMVKVDYNQRINFIACKGKQNASVPSYIFTIYRFFYHWTADRRHPMLDITNYTNRLDSSSTLGCLFTFAIQYRQKNSRA